ncbi:MAG: hypothetical protein V4537_15860 [Pseudomonadota bacterium]
MTVATLPDLDRRLSRKIEAGKTIQLSPADLDLLVTTGAIATFRNAVAKHQRDECQKRSAGNRSTSAETSVSSHGTTDPISKSSGMMPPPDVSEALQRAQAITGARG